MVKTYTRLRTLFLLLFAIGATASWGYQMFYLKPKKECDRGGGWWDPKGRVCAMPIDITQITGRPIGAPPVTPGAPDAAPPTAAQPR